MQGSKANSSGVICQIFMDVRFYFCFYFVLFISGRISKRDGILRRIPIRIQPPSQPNRIGAQIPPGTGIIIPVPVILYRCPILDYSSCGSCGSCCLCFCAYFMDVQFLPILAIQFLLLGDRNVGC